MSLIEIDLNEETSKRLEALATRRGKTPVELVNDAVEKLVAEELSEEDEHKQFLAWREALLAIKGMWADRTDLPDFVDIRRSMDRDLWEKK